MPRDCDDKIIGERMCQAIETLVDQVNAGLPVDLDQAIVQVLQRSHRPLQQSLWSAIKTTILVKVIG